MAKRFFLGVFFILAVYVMAAWGIIRLAHFSAPQIDGIFYSGILGTVNIVLAFLIIKFSIERDQKTFSKIFLVGLIVRLLGLMIFIWIIFNYTDVNRFIFIGSLFILYFLYQIWEVLILYSSYK